MTDTSLKHDTTVATLPNGVRVVAMRLPHLDSVSASVFVRAGSGHESARLNGISHLVEHMAFKGTATRTCQQINLDAEQLGAEVNAHTDRDHTAFHMRGLARDAVAFVRMLGDIVRNSTFPDDELANERRVILQEMAEEEDDGVEIANKLFDTLCFGTHPIAQPIVGTRRSIERITRDDLLAFVERLYTGSNVVLGVAGNIDPAAVVRAAEAAFGAIPGGAPNRIEPTQYVGGFASRRLPGSTQTHIVLGFPVPSLAGPYAASVVAAALFGEGMSSPLMDEIRERRGLAYYTGCTADLTAASGQFVIDASTAPEHAVPFLTAVARLLADHAASIAPVALQRARNQLAVRSLDLLERPARGIEGAAQDLFVHGRLRSRAEWLAEVDAVTPDAVREVFATMLSTKAAVAATGKVPRAMNEGVLDLFTPNAR